MPLHIPLTGVEESPIDYLSRRIPGSRQRSQVTTCNCSSLPKSEVCNENSAGLSINISCAKVHTTGCSQPSPFERLPVELKVEIFSHCLASYPPLSANGAPLLLCGICTSWRALVQSTPKLWSRFGINVATFGSTSESQMIHTLKMVDIWLSRSRKYPLSIRICDDPVGRVPDTRSAQILAALVPHANRWRYIHFSIPNSSITPLQHSLPPVEGFRALRSLTLDVRARWASYTPLDIHALGFPWGRLTELYLRLDSNNPLTLDQCLDILAEGANLVRCTLNAECTLDLRGSRLDKIPLNSMQHFELILLRRFTETPEICLITFLEQLQFSKLRKLGIDWLVQWDDTNVQHWYEIHPRFISLLGGLGHSLEALRVAHLPLSEDQILGSLAMLPLLINLDLRFSMADREHDPISNDLLYALTLQAGNPSRQSLQQLETLHIRCSGARFNTSMLLSLVHSRWTSSPMEKANKRLKAFKFISLRPVGKFARQKVKIWGEEGLVIAIGGIDIR